MVAIDPASRACIKQFVSSARLTEHHHHLPKVGQ